ncbi:hypothetical protein HZY97_04925 [Sphingomonas sp. R-74633]|uniref:hypothetical protein n=1 Tax=Sphingomonas sp. R-74633 TaxID=2751188 RepID=UPI0015D17BC1|nr:hypothetical protein [Sphingomonas sp. R-74633]NYT40088.1 hypothetical protein [Sphingomonas sp. R-74633]
MLLLALLAQAVTPDTEVKINPAGENSFMIEILTVESAAVAAEKMQAASAEACKATGVASVGMTIVGTARKTKKTPARNQILQFVNCKKPAP